MAKNRRRIRYWKGKMKFRCKTVGRGWDRVREGRIKGTKIGGGIKKTASAGEWAGGRVGNLRVLIETRRWVVLRCVMTILNGRQQGSAPDQLDAWGRKEEVVQQRETLL